MIEKNRTLEQQLEAENQQYRDQLKLIESSNATAEHKTEARKGLAKQHDENTTSIKFDIFKRDSDWVTIFDNLDRVSSTTINGMIKRIDEFSRTTGLSVEDVKRLRDALEKLQAEQAERNPFEIGRASCRERV